MTTLDIKTGRIVTREPRDDYIMVTRKNWEIIVNNSNEYIKLFEQIEKRLNALEKRYVPRWWLL